MQTTQPLETPPTMLIMRRGARLLSAAVLLFWGWFLIAHIFGNEGRSSRPLIWQDYAILTSLVAALAGLAMAWKWELAGAALTLGATSIGALLNWRVLAFPGTLIPIAAVMFLLCSAMNAARSREQPRQLQ